MHAAYLARPTQPIIVIAAAVGLITIYPYSVSTMNPFSRRQFVGMALAGTAVGAPPDPKCNVLAFGATGDGTSDDTDAIQRAVDAGLGAAHFTKGVYRLTRTIQLDLSRTGPTSLLGDGSARIVMAGAGPAFHLVGTHTGTADPQTVHDNVWNRERMPIVSGFEILGEHPESIGLRAEGTMQAILAHLNVRRCHTGIQIVRRNRNLIVSECHIYHNRAIGLDFDQVSLHQAIIADNHISYNPVAGIRMLGGDMRNFQIVGNDIEYNYDPDMEDCADILVDMRAEGSSFRETTIVGNTIQARPSPNGANIRMIGGEHPWTGGMCAISGNFISHQTTNLHLVRCRSVSVTGNSFATGADRTFWLEKCANVVLSSNTIDMNPVRGPKRCPDGVVIDECDAIHLSDMILENCFQGSEQEGGAIEVRNSRDVTLANSQVLDPRYRGIVLHNVERCRVTGCTVIDRRKTPTMLKSIVAGGSGRDNLIDNNMVNRGSIEAPGDGVHIRDNHEVAP